MPPDATGVLTADPSGTVVMADGRSFRIHSAYDPVAEAAGLLEAALADDPPVVIVIGPGLGYVMDAIEHRARATRILALEPSAVVARAMLARRDWSAWLDARRLTLLVGPDYEGASDAWSTLDIRTSEPPLIVAPVADRLYPEGVARARNIASRIIAGGQANEEARRRFAGRYLLNTLMNLPVIGAEADAASIAGEFAGVPAIVVAAGPSLDRNIPAIAALEDRAVIVAVDTAVRPLLAAGIRPDLAVAVDPSEANARHLKDLPDARGIHLAAEGSVDPEVFPQFKGRTFTFNVSDHEPWPWLREHGIERGTLKAWGSVLTTAFDLAVRAGCDPIVFAGADLAYTDGVQYARNTVYEPLWNHWTTDAERAAALLPWLRERPTLMATDVRGGQVLTVPHFIQFRDWLVSRAYETGRQVKNATGGGILHGRGIEQIDFTDGPGRLGSSAPLDARARLALAWARDLPARRAARDRLARALIGTDERAIPYDAWLDFTRRTVTFAEIHPRLLAARNRLQG